MPWVSETSSSTLAHIPQSFIHKGISIYHSCKPLQPRSPGKNPGPSSRPGGWRRLTSNLQAGPGRGWPLLNTTRRAEAETGNYQKPALVQRKDIPWKENGEQTIDEKIHKFQRIVLGMECISRTGDNFMCGREQEVQSRAEVSGRTRLCTLCRA